MSGVIETFLICDGHCGTNFGVDMRHRTLGEQKKEARKDGWACNWRGDYCPDCRKKPGKPKKDAR